MNSFVMRGEIRASARMQGVIRSCGNLSAVIRYADTIGGIPYEGAYVIRPTLDAQMMETKHKSMTDNVTVEAIPISYVGNTAGGETAIIG